MFLRICWQNSCKKLNKERLNQKMEVKIFNVYVGFFMRKPSSPRKTCRKEFSRQGLHRISCQKAWTQWSSLILAQKARATVPYMLSQCKNENTQKLAQVDLGNCDPKKTNWQHNSPRQSHSHGYNNPVCSTSDISAQEPDNLSSVIYYFFCSWQGGRMQFKNLCTINMLLEVTAKYSLQINK